MFRLETATSGVRGGPADSSQPPMDQAIYALISDLGEMQEASDRGDLFAGLAQAITSSVGADACLVSLLEPDGKTLSDVAASVVAPARLHRVVEQFKLEDFPVTEEVVRTGRWVEIALSNPDDHPSEKEYLEQVGFARVLMCRLLIDEETVGTVEAYRSSDDRPFNCEDAGQIALLGTFASNAYARIQMSEKLETHYTTTLEALAAALEAKDPYTQAHTGRIRDLSLALGVAMKVPSHQRRAVRLGAILHDVGKIGISDTILHKPGPLTESEWKVMQTHPIVGERMLRGIDFLTDALPVIRHHHERWDGAGYPDRLAGEDIPLGARIVAVCDAFDAMTSDRPYRKAMSHDLACEEILACAGAQFDPNCATLLTEVLADVGSDHLEQRLVRYAS
jgi:HD-GYP domain-containing protein (c-di-GMP phosphodiesterase class II)